MAETLKQSGLPEQGGILGWLKRNPLQALLIATLGATLFYFFGVWGEFGPSRGASTLVWMWRVCAPDTVHDYEHGRFIPLVIAFLLWRSRKDIAAAPKSSWWLGMAFIICGVLLFVLSARMIQVRLAAVGFPLVLWGIVAYGWGKEVARHFIFPCLLFGFAIPMPGMIQATNGLQVIATQIAFHVSSLLGADIVMNGTTINPATAGQWGEGFGEVVKEGQQKKEGLEIAGGCSGVRSLVALTFIAAVYGQLTQNKLWKKLALIAAAIPLAIFANSLRVTTIVLLAEYYDVEFASKTYHNFSGFIFFPLGLVGLLVVAFLLNGGWKKQRQNTRVTTIGGGGGGGATPASSGG